MNAKEMGVFNVFSQRNGLGPLEVKGKYESFLG